MRSTVAELSESSIISADDIEEHDLEEMDMVDHYSNMDFSYLEERINPEVPVDLVIDHSVQVDYYGMPDALKKNVKREFERNKERYQFLKWAQSAFNNFSVVPPSTGIVHQVNLEYLAKVVVEGKIKEGNKDIDVLYPDTLVGTDSHTTMINGLGVLG